MIVVLFAWVEGKKRAPEIKGERTTCNDCGGQLTAVLPLQNVPHWRHLAGECDPWSEPEGPWHLWWKSQFDISECEIGLLDDVTGERHRADVLVTGATQTTVLELQHSSISDEERAARELFYARGRRMFWLLDMHDEKSFRAYNFGFCFRTNPPSAMVGTTKFDILQWSGRGSQFIEKWKRSSVHVFLHFNRTIYYLATPLACGDLVRSLAPKQFALSAISEKQFADAVRN